MSEKGVHNLNVAFLCDCLGPYHYARLNAAHRRVPTTAVEFSSLDHTNIWEPFDNKEHCPKVTLFRDKPITLQSWKTVIKRVRNALDELRPDVAVISGWDALASLAALQWCLQTRTPTVLMSESQKKDEPRVWWKEAVKKRIVRLNTVGLAGGTPQADYLKFLGIPADRVFLGCDVIDNDYFMENAQKARQDSASLRKQYCLPDHYFLSVSRFVHKKNLFSVLKAYADYVRHSKEQAWKLVLIGDGPLKADIVSLQEELGLADMILMPGVKQYSELPVYYGLAEALVLASTTEQWGLVVNEAMACGLPVIVSSQCGCVPDLVRHGDNGYIFDPYNVDELSHHLIYVAGDECPRISMGESGRKIIKDWSLDFFASNFYQAVTLARTISEHQSRYLDRVFLRGLIMCNALRKRGQL